MDSCSAATPGIGHGYHAADDLDRSDCLLHAVKVGEGNRVVVGVVGLV